MPIRNEAILKCLFILVMGFTIGYLCLSFYNLDLRSVNWTFDERACCLVISVAWSFILFIVTDYFENKQKGSYEFK